MALPHITLRRHFWPWASALIFLILLFLIFRASSYHQPRLTPPNPTVFRKEFVVASLKVDDTSWLSHYLPDWKANIYVVDDHAAKLTVPANKGREAMVYLTHIIDNYDMLPNVMVFIHSLRYQWHNDDPLYDGIPVLQALQLPYILSEGYINLRCVWTLGCPAELKFDRETQDRPTEVAYPKAFAELFPGHPVPDSVGVACCAQFAATREKIRERPREDYEYYRKWLRETDLEDATSGRIMEYSWHIIFGRQAVHCPDVAECYCRTFGLCNLVCEQDKCGERWPFPPYSTLPQGWPQKGWKGEDRSPEYLANLRNTSMSTVAKL